MKTLLIAVLLLFANNAMAEDYSYTVGEWTFVCQVRQADNTIVDANNGVLTLRIASNMAAREVIMLPDKTRVFVSTLPTNLKKGLYYADSGMAHCIRDLK